MYTLIDDLARRRCLYPRILATLPDILLIDIPPRFASRELPMGRYYPILVETNAELDELESYLAEPRPGPISPVLLDHRPSQIHGTRITLAAYAPPAAGWPHVLLCHWPPSYAAIAQDPMLFARGAYTTEVFATEEALYLSCEQLLATLGQGTDVTLVSIKATLQVTGRA